MHKKLIILLIVAFVMNSCAVRKVLSVDKSQYLSAADVEDILRPYGLREEFQCVSSVPGPTSRRVLVYLPGDYYDNDVRYPVLYLFHGARGNETSWIKDGDVLEVMDSMIASGRAVKHILVLANMNQYDDDADYEGSRFKKPFESFFESNGAVESGFMQDVVSSVDSIYRTIPEKGCRAIAGLSLGAFQAMHISASAPYSFDYVGLFSPMSTAPIRQSGYSDFYKNLAARQYIQFIQPPKLYMVAIGHTDVFYWDAKHYRRYMDKNGYGYEYFHIPGGHEWKNWKVFYSEFVKKIFR